MRPTRNAFYLLLTTLAVILASQTTEAADRFTGAKFATRSEVIAPHGMVASSHPLATQIGLDILKQGGNAVDAAIAVNAALGLMEPTGNGIGGDLFAIVWDAESKQLYGLNATGRSPRSLTREWLIENDYQTIPGYGPLSVTVPGAVDGWFMLSERFGSMPMSALLEPAIEYARAGHPVHEVVAYYWDGHIEARAPWPGYVEQMTINGRAPRKGEIWKNQNLANTLETIAREGRDAYYKGDIARTISDFMAENGGFLSYEDLASHSGYWFDPVSSNYRGYDVWELPPNSQGIAALQLLNILEGFDIASMGFGSAEYIHHFAEAKKLVFEDRARYYADPEFNKIPVTELISKQYAEQRRKLIDPESAAAELSPGDPTILEQGDTVYLSTADSQGNMVSLIQSNWRGSGSGMTPPGLGFVLQDRAEAFSMDEGDYNVYAPGKRPFHTNIPAFVTRNGEPLMAFGVMGGAMQPQGHAQIIINMVDFGMNLQEAGDAPRIRHVGTDLAGDYGPNINGGYLTLESGFGDETEAALEAMGHTIRPTERGPFGGYQAILRDPESGVYYGASESRKDGQAAGY